MTNNDLRFLKLVFNIIGVSFLEDEKENGNIIVIPFRKIDNPTLDDLAQNRYFEFSSEGKFVAYR